MAKTIEYDRPSFLHWESDPSQSRETLTLSAAAKIGDLLILGDSGYASYNGSAPSLKVSYDAGDIVVAVALEAGKAGDKVACIVRNATIIQDKINHVQNDAFDAGEPLEALKAYFARQMLIPRLSIAVQRGVRA